MKWRGRDDLHVWKLVFLALFFLWLLFLWQTPPSEGLWKDVRCNLVDGYPRDCETAYRLYPDPSAWWYEWVLEPLGWPTQDW